MSRSSRELNLELPWPASSEFRSLVSTNLEGFIFITQLSVQRMLSQVTGPSVAVS